MTRHLAEVTFPDGIIRVVIMNDDWVVVASLPGWDKQPEKTMAEYRKEAAWLADRKALETFVTLVTRRGYLFPRKGFQYLHHDHIWRRADGIDIYRDLMNRPEDERGERLHERTGKPPRFSRSSDRHGYAASSKRRKLLDRVADWLREDVDLLDPDKEI